MSKVKDCGIDVRKSKLRASLRRKETEKKRIQRLKGANDLSGRFYVHRGYQIIDEKLCGKEYEKVYIPDQYIRRGHYEKVTRTVNILNPLTGRNEEKTYWNYVWIDDGVEFVKAHYERRSIGWKYKPLKRKRVKRINSNRKSSRRLAERIVRSKLRNIDENDASYNGNAYKKFVSWFFD